MKPTTTEPDRAETQAREEVLAAITRQARSVGEQADVEASQALEHLARALAALPGRGTTHEVDTDTAAGLQMTGPGQKRSGGHKAGLALELEQ